MRSPIDLITESFTLYRNNFATLIGYSAWILLPFAGFVLLNFLPRTLPILSLGFILFIIETFIAVWISIILIQLSASIIQNKTVVPIQLQQSSTKLIYPVLIVGLLQLLVILGGFILLIIPGLIFMVWYVFVQFSAVLDNKKGMEALSHSKTLVQGRFWKTLLNAYGGSLLILLFYSFIIAIIISLVATASGVQPELLLSGDILWVNIIESLGDVIFIPWIVIYLTQVYLDAKQSYKPTTLEKKPDIA